jgi:16S rRNA (adenine1518-N6/adenine1519-N6)-dimethyltransferase
VDSAVVSLTPRATPVVEAALEKRFRSFVLAAFGLRRKQLVRVVRTAASLDAERALAVVTACGLNPEARPETLTPAEFALLVRALADVSGRDDQAAPSSR